MHRLRLLARQSAARSAVALGAFALAALPVAAQTIYQDLDEATARIARLADKPYEKLIDKDGYYQSETLIFKDVQTGREIWSLTQDQSKDLANIERRPVFSCDGSVMSMVSTRVYFDPQHRLRDEKYEHHFLIDADLTHRRYLWSNLNGKPTALPGKFDTWDEQKPRTLYYVAEDHLYRVALGNGVLDNQAEAIYTFPDKTRRILQNIDDQDRLCIQDWNAAKASDKTPMFYIIDVTKKPGDPGFARSHSLRYNITGVAGHDPHNEYHVHDISIERGRGRVSWNYGPMTDVGETVNFSVPVDNLDATPQPLDPKTDPYGQYHSHGDYSIDGSQVYFAGPLVINGKEDSASGSWGIWVARLNRKPVYTGARIGSGHTTWCGNDPDWWFANCSDQEVSSWMDKQWFGTIVAGNADGTGVQILCKPYDRKRGGKFGYDAIPRPTQSPDATKCWFHSGMLMPSNEFTGSYIVVFRHPYAPTDLKFADGRLTWTPHAVTQEVKGYFIYRKDGQGWTQLNADPVTATSFAPPQASGQYMVSSVEWSGLESDVSSPTITLPAGTVGEPVKDWDRSPPQAPSGFSATREGTGQYRLGWEGPPDKDVRYYNLYFSSQSRPQAVQQRRFASPARSVTSYLDWTAPKAGPAYYAITAVDRAGNESQAVFAEMPQ